MPFNLHNFDFQSPSKAVYNMRSWQDDFDEEDRVTLQIAKNVHSASVCFTYISGYQTYPVLYMKTLARS